MQLVAAATDLNNDILYLQQIDAQFIKVIREAHYDYHENSTYTSHVYQRIIDYNVSSSLINSIVYYSASRPEPYALITDATVRYEDGKFLLLNSPYSPSDSILFDPEPYYDASEGQLIFLHDAHRQYLIYFPVNYSSGNYVRFYILDLYEIEQRLNSLTTKELLAITLTDSGGECVTSVNPSLLPKLMSAQNAEHIPANQGKNSYIKLDFREGYSLIALLSDEALTHYLHTAFSNSYLSFMLIGFVGLFLVLLVMQFTYVPLRKLVKRVLPELDHKQLKRKDYIGILDEAITSKEEQNEYLQDKFASYRISTHKMLLESIVGSDNFLWQDKMAHMDQLFDADNNREIYVVCMSSGDGPLPGSKICSYFEEILPGENVCLRLDNEKKQAIFLLNYTGTDPEKKEVLKTLLTTFYEENGYFSSISNSSSSPMDIPVLYQNALQARKYWSETPVAVYCTPTSGLSDTLYPHEKLKHLSEFLQNDCIEGSFEITEDLFLVLDNITESKQPFAEFQTKSILIDMVVLIANSMNHFEIKFKSYNELFFETLYLCRNFSYTEKRNEIQENIRSFLNLYVQEMTNRVIHPTRIIRIIEESFCDPNFSIYMLADKFNISVAYMSYLFKKEFNQNFSDYLWSLRLQKAQELLCDTNLPIEEISHRIGYISASGFRRKFNQDMGMSPAQFRKEQTLSTKV